MPAHARHLRPLLPAAFLAFAFSAAGCKSMTPGNLSRVQPNSDQPLAGNVYLLRGFIGIWSTGIDNLGQKIAAAGIRTSVFQDDQWQDLASTIIARYRAIPSHEPIILIGHSYGADDVLRIAKNLQGENIPVDLVVTLDAVTPPTVPSNVRLCYNIFQSSALDALPFFRGVPLDPESPNTKNVANINVRTDRRDLLLSDTDHFNIEKNPKIHDEVIKKLKEVCPPRKIWLASPSPSNRQDRGDAKTSPRPNRPPAPTPTLSTPPPSRPDARSQAPANRPPLFVFRASSFVIDSTFELRHSDFFRVSDFGFRVSPVAFRSSFPS